MSLIERVQSILLRPKQTWPVIAAEPADVASIYSRYVVILAAIPAICAFIGWTLVGGGAFGVTYRLPIATGLVQMVVGYLLSLAIVYVLALIVNALAPTFGGTQGHGRGAQGRRLRQHRGLSRRRLQPAAVARAGSACSPRSIRST